MYVICIKTGRHYCINGDRWRRAMNASMRQFAHGLLFFVGLMLVFGGILKGFYGASIVGLIVAAVNLGHWRNMNRQ